MTIREILSALEEGDDLNHDDPAPGMAGVGQVDFAEVRPVWAGVPIGWVARGSELAASDRPWLAITWSDAPGARRGWGRTLCGQHFATAEEGADALGAAWRRES
jgi:hypothetical protein